MTIIKPSYPRLQRSQSNDLLLALPFYEGGGLQVNDLSGRNNHSTLANGPTWVAGRHGWALNFDGNDDTVSFPRVTLSGAFSVCVWSRITNAAVLRTIIGDDSFGDRIGYDLTAGKVLIRLINVNDSAIDRPAVGNWGFYCLTRDSADKIDLSIDGGPFTRLYANAARVGMVNFNGLSNVQRHHGQIDDVRVYNRALSAAEVAAIYHDPWIAYRPAKKISVLAVAPVKPSVEITPQPAIALATVVAPNVMLGSVAITPQPATAITNVTAPIALLGSILVTPQPAIAITGGEVVTRISGASAAGKTISPTFRRLAYQPAMRKLAIAPTFTKL